MEILEKNKTDVTGHWIFGCRCCGSLLKVFDKDFTDEQRLVVVKDEPRFIWVCSYICPACNKKVYVTSEELGPRYHKEN